jgi:hypothetical protein
VKKFHRTGPRRRAGCRETALAAGDLAPFVAGKAQHEDLAKGTVPANTRIISAMTMPMADKKGE